jgi:uroporphyrinogen-III synthase
VGAEALHAIGANLAFAAVGPTTAAAIRTAGVQVAVEASTATSEGLAKALEHYFVRSRAETGGMG